MMKRAFSRSLWEENIKFFTTQHFTGFPEDKPCSTGLNFGPKFQFFERKGKPILRAL
jgi:hypothetical protein